MSYFGMGNRKANSFTILGPSSLGIYFYFWSLLGTSAYCLSVSRKKYFHFYDQDCTESHMSVWFQVHDMSIMLRKQNLMITGVGYDVEAVSSEWRRILNCKFERSSWVLSSCPLALPVEISLSASLDCGFLRAGPPERYMAVGMLASILRQQTSTIFSTSSYDFLLVSCE